MHKGFTFIEFLLYFAVVGVVLFVTGAIALNIVFGKAKLAAVEEVSQNARFVAEKVALSVQNAHGVNTPTAGTASTVLSLDTADLAKNPTVFDLDNGTARIREGAGSPVALTSSQVIMTELNFFNVSAPGAPGTIRIQMTVQANNPSGRREYEFIETFYTTAHVRKK